MSELMARVHLQEILHYALRFNEGEDGNIRNRNQEA
jgi:hypothetical protein